MMGRDPLGQVYRRAAMLFIPAGKSWLFTRSFMDFRHRHVEIEGDVDVVISDGQRFHVPFSVQIPVQTFRVGPFLSGDGPWDYFYRIFFL
jgi:hypothetical protein